MDWYIWALIIIGVIVFLIIQSERAKKGAIKKLEHKIKSDWGKQTKREYTHNEYSRIKRYFDSKKGEAAVDDITWNDLNMDEIFMDINNTSSSVGEECLYKILRDITFDENELKKRDKIIDYFIGNKENAWKIEKIYSLIGRTKSISLYEFIHRIEEADRTSNVYHYLCSLFLIASIILFIFMPEIGILSTIFVFAVNVITYFSAKSKIENYFVCFKYIVSMLDGAKELCKLGYDELYDYNNRLKELNGKLKPHFRGAVFLTTNAMGGSLAEILMDYVRMVTHIDIICFNSMAGALKKNRKNIDDLYETLGELEALYAVASYRCFLREQYGYYCKPEFSDDKKLCAMTVYHPLISEPVSNSIDVSKSVLLTGSNASGKSTFLKTIAINGVLSQSIYTCTAESFAMPNSMIMSSMALKDDLQNNESYYIVEIKSLKRILDKMNEGKRIICFVDEVLRGTNTVERIAASSEILKSLEKENVICFAATHDIELTHILEKYYDNYHFREEIKNNDILFDYKLFNGRAVTRNAIKLLSIIGYDNGIIKDAEEKAMNFLEKGIWE